MYKRQPYLYLSPDQAKFWVYDSLLSEYAGMGFEYGYSVERPDALVLWAVSYTHLDVYKRQT